LKINTYLKSYLSQSPTKVHWSLIGIHNHHGVAISLSSLISNNSSGIGEFYDLIPLIKWLSEIKMDVIQLLPLNDKGNDPSPYNSLSAKALDPIHISLHSLPYLQDHKSLIKKLKPLQELSNSQRVRYVEVKHRKIEFLREYFEGVFYKFENDENYQNFQIKNPWLGIYALYKHLKEKNDNKVWMSWSKELKNSTSIKKLMKKHQQEIKFYIFLQFLCFEQLIYIKKFASSHSVFLKGDIPILLSADSADVWHNQKFFDLKYSAGAPPDAYNSKGQYWGFPLYNWEEHKKKHYSWWRERLSVASQIYHLYRIDHVVGFFRIWAIAENDPPVKGFFKPQNFHSWPFLGKDLLKMLINSSTMLPIAEDLGTIPKFVPRILKELGIPGTKIMRWERRWEEDANFVDIKNYEPISLTSVATHDSEMLAEWWEKYPRESKLYSAQIKKTYEPSFNNELRFKILSDSHNSPSIFHINPLQEYLAFFPELVWENPEDERINIPGITSSFNWTYRFRPKIEEIISHKQLKLKMQKLID